MNSNFFEIDRRTFLTLIDWYNKGSLITEKRLIDIRLTETQPRRAIRLHIPSGIAYYNHNMVAIAMKVIDEDQGAKIRYLISPKHFEGYYVIKYYDQCMRDEMRD